MVALWGQLHEPDFWRPVAVVIVTEIMKRGFEYFISSSYLLLSSTGVLWLTGQQMTSSASSSWKPSKEEREKHSTSGWSRS